MSVLDSVRLTAAEAATLEQQHPALAAAVRAGESTALVTVGSAHLVAAAEAVVRHLAADESLAARVVET